MLAGSGDGGDVVEGATDLLTEIERAAGAADVEVEVLLLTCRHVIESREVDHMVDGALQALDVDGRQSKAFGPQVAHHGMQTISAGQAIRDPLQSGKRARPCDHVHRRVRPPQQPLEQVPAEKARAAGHEVGGHCPEVRPVGSLSASSANRLGCMPTPVYENRV